MRRCEFGHSVGDIAADIDRNSMAQLAIRRAHLEVAALRTGM